MCMPSRFIYVRNVSLLILILTCVPLIGQQITGTITGLVADQSGAAVPNAKVVAKNEGSGDVRQTVTNTDGYFTLASVPAGTYSITVEAAGFSRWQQNALPLNAGDKRTLADIVLAVGT